MDVKTMDAPASPRPLGPVSWADSAGGRLKGALGWIRASAFAGGGGAGEAMARRLAWEEAAKKLDARVLRDIGFYDECAGSGANECPKEE